MPNGGIDNCGLCGFNRANAGVWWNHENITKEKLENAFCTLRSVKVTVPMWTYCLNFETKKTEPDGPICMVGLIEKKPGWLYARIPWHGTREPKLCVAGTCGCGRAVAEGIAVQTEDGPQFFCCNAHYIAWWRKQHPNETYRWDLKEWPEPSDEGAG